MDTIYNQKSVSSEFDAYLTALNLSRVTVYNYKSDIIKTGGFMLMKRLKRYFATGLLVILPIFLTLYLIFIIFRLIDNIAGGIINSYLKAAFGFSIPGSR